LRALSLERFGLGAHLAAIERLKQRSPTRGSSTSRASVRCPASRAGSASSPARRGRATDVITTIHTRFPPRASSSPRRSSRGRGSGGIVEALASISASPGSTWSILTRGGGSFDDLLPFSDESVVRAVAACPVPVVSAVGHEQDTPLCDLAADVRASTPTAAGKLVVPDLEALRVELTRAAPQSSAVCAG
jgi:exodeoxyribonuclease VII large subunit